MTNGFEGVFSEVEKQYMPSVLAKVRDRAKDLATKDNREEPNYIDVFRVFENSFGSSLPCIQRESIFRENLFLIVVVTMTVIFGIMGLAPYLLADPNRVGYKSDVFLDIAKLFAGVVVGGAAGVAAGTAARTARGSKP
jgi:hypothetical protein